MERAMPHSWDGKWNLGAELGQGGQGITHVATFADDPSVRGVLKRLKRRKSQQARARMRREVTNLQALATVVHSVPRVLDHNTGDFEDQNVELFVVMDLIEGPTLMEHVENAGPLEAGAAVAFTMSLCKTVELAHKEGVLHRDLKPDNVIVRNAENSELVVIDYGLSFNTDDESVTQTGETFRNKFLTLPETVAPGGDLRDHRSDITAVCAIFYFCLTGHIPGVLQDGNGTLPHMRDAYSVRSALDDDDRISSIEDLLTRGFAPNIANRYQTVEEVVSKVNELVQEDYDSNDPIQLAASLSVKLLALDRPSQLGRFRKEAGLLFEQITFETNKYQGKLGQFQVQNAGGIHPQAPSDATVPTGLDLVSFSPGVIRLQVAEHKFQKHIRYAVASRGEQCGLLSTVVHSDQGSPPKDVGAAYDWQEVAWYDGHAESIKSLVAMSFRELLVNQMQSISNEIFDQ
jgi:serine/threonine protein kinase